MCDRYDLNGVTVSAVPAAAAVAAAAVPAVAAAVAAAAVPVPVAGGQLIPGHATTSRCLGQAEMEVFPRGFTE